MTQLEFARIGDISRNSLSCYYSKLNQKQVPINSWHIYLFWL